MGTVPLSHDMLAIGAIECLSEKGIRIPDQIRVIGFDGIEMSGVVKPSLTTISQNIPKIGELAVRYILDQIDQKKIEQNPPRVPVSLIRRETA